MESIISVTPRNYVSNCSIYLQKYIFMDFYFDSMHCLLAPIVKLLVRLFNTCNTKLFMFHIFYFRYYKFYFLFLKNLFFWSNLLFLLTIYYLHNYIY